MNLKFTGHDNEEWCKIWSGIDVPFQWAAKSEGKMTCSFKNDMKNLTNFHRMKNSNFILESKIAVLDQNKKSKQPDRPDAAWKLQFTLGIIE